MKNILNKKQLAKELTNKTTLSLKEAEQVVSELFDIIIDKVSQDIEISIVGFGKFYAYKHKPRPVRNPKTQEEMILSPYTSIKFKPSNLIKKKLKNKTNKEE